MFELGFEGLVRLSGGRVFQMGVLVGAKAGRQEQEKNIPSQDAWKMEEGQYPRSEEVA